MKGAVAIVNARLRLAGRSERVIRARGYYRLADGDAVRFHESGLYGIGAQMVGPEYVEHLAAAVERVFEENGIAISIRGTGERRLPLGTTLDQWKAEVLNLYPEARFQHESALHKWHARVGLLRKGSWFGYYDGGPNPYTQSWVKL